MLTTDTPLIRGGFRPASRRTISCKPISCRPSSCSHPHASRILGKGFTLIEVLITLLLTGTTLLALATLQLRTLQQSHFSYQRTQANLQAADFIEHLWLARCTLPDTLSDLDESHPAFQAWYQQHQSTPLLPGWQAQLQDLSAGQIQLSINWLDRQSELPQQTAPLNYPLVYQTGSC